MIWLIRTIVALLSIGLLVILWATGSNAINEVEWLFKILIVLINLFITGIAAATNYVLWIKVKA